MRKSLILVDEPIDFQKRLRVITLNRPEKRNALNEEMLRTLIKELKDAESTPRVRAVVITGAGEHAFCAGADLSTIQTEEGGQLGVSAFGELFLTMNSLKVPIIAGVNGIAVGGGLGILLASDLVVMSETARIGAPEIRRGLFAMYITRYVYQMFPEKIANEMLFTGSMLNASTLKQLGVVNEVVPLDQVKSCALGMAHRVCEMSGAVLRLGKSAIRQQRELSFEHAIQFLGGELKTNLRLKDSKEGIAAFLQKRDPIWQDA